MFLQEWVESEEQEAGQRAVGVCRRHGISEATFCTWDDFTCECLALVADTSLSGARVAREIDALTARRGNPLLVVSDSGTELTSTAILR